MQKKIIKISDSIHGTISLSQYEKDIISTTIFNRLHNISQNSTLYLTFPPNKTKRFEHSVGTMKLCGDMFYYSFCNSDTNTINSFFMRIEDYINTTINDILKSSSNKSKDYRDKIGDENLEKKKLELYKKITFESSVYNLTPNNIKKDEHRVLYVILFQAVRICGLLHDIGHPPFSHVTENALKNIWSFTKKLPISNTFIASVERYFPESEDDDETKLHERIGLDIIDKLLLNIIKNNDSTEEKTIQDRMFRVLIREFVCSIMSEKEVDSIFKSIHLIIDGSLDGDRLDYVCREPLNSGFNSGKIEYERLVNSFVLKRMNNDFIFCPEISSLNTITDFFQKRWNMYKYIIYHHRVIKTDFLLQSCIEELSKKYFESTDVSESEDDEKVLPYDISGLWKGLRDLPSKHNFFNSLIQWDDSWLITILKKHYFKEYADKNSDSDEYVCRCKLEELISNKKYYYSLIKKPIDFLPIDKNVGETLLPILEVISKKVSTYIENSKNIDLIDIKQDAKKQDAKKQDAEINLDNISEQIEDLIIFIKEYANLPLMGNGFVFSRIFFHLNNLFGESKTIETDIIKKVRENANFSTLDKIRDLIIVFKAPSKGTKKGLYLFNPNKLLEISEFVKFKDISITESMLEFDRLSLPVFYIYVLKKSNIELNYDKIKIDIGKLIGGVLSEKIEAYINKLNL